MQNFVNNNYDPNINFFQQLPDPAQNEPFNRATHPADKPIISKHIFAVDSRQRDYDFYPHANNYNIPIPDRYRNVSSIELKAAMLPRSEYNVNGSNKYMDFSVGDYIRSIRTKNNLPITKTNSSTGKEESIGPGTFKLNIIPSNGSDIEVILNSNSNITSYNFINQGSGFSNTSPPNISLGNYTDFNVIVGLKYTAELREGQYVIGGNPQFTEHKSGGSTVSQSWVPNNFLNEIESAMSYAILKHTSNGLDHCYSRKPWTSGDSGTAPSSTDDYPLLFTARLMSQYPSLDTYSNNSRIDVSNFETNSCKFNRIYTTSCLIFRTNSLETTYTDSDGFIYDVLHHDVVSTGSTIDPSDEEYIVYCKLNDSFQKVGSGSYWTGLAKTSHPYDLRLEPWELLFATGEYNVVNSATLLGYNKRNYGTGISNDAIEVMHILGEKTTLVPVGNTYSAENDYYMYGDPEYVVLSFRPKYGGNSITGINDRVDSQENTNIDRVFACLIFDTVQPAVLQDVSSGNSDATIGSMGNENNKLGTFMNYDSALSEVKQLTGNSGSQNVSYGKGSGQLKAMKGADFDRKVIDFPQPVAQISNLNIRFSKFSHLGQGHDNELYDFHGKEHLLLFEITCSDLMTGRRF